MRYTDIVVVQDFEEAEQFRYEHNDETVEVGTAVGYDQPFVGMPGDKPPPEGWDTANKDVIRLVCFEGIYYDPGE
jgi:hypothetical protein